ncbi:hypothetical protein ACQP2F_23735 [Actinoplanes sp. CA-030573]|uniref:hypothetical protein n=1 Tax=Actinoplanes sp. CA-030573 TaxID=3239898 RepID=UPI003D8FB675
MRDRTPPPSFRLPVQSEPGPEERKVTGAQAILLSIIAMALVCCAGGFAISLFTSDGGKRAAAVTQVTTAAQPPVTEPATGPATTAPATEPATTAPATTAPARTEATTKVAAKPAPTTKKPTTKKPTTTRPTGTTTPAGNAPGAPCSPVGKFGHSSTGELMRCVRKPGEDRARWRKV